MTSTLSCDRFAIALLHGDWALRQAVNAALEVMDALGRLPE